ncbi:Ubiquitin fusion degradation UFD1 family protein [Zea mays]|uniref:Ubiquitin fusion degradation UFD1 family protein n=1 Tax=Zea mays TaxID=4577 RepID=A0A1D6MLI6_MAIZE|nr:Ubiquitin fusion degradation UFD1 family protein [Zea mays]
MQCSNLLLLHLNFAVIMPLSALDRLGGLNIEYPMLFQIKHPSTERATHCGVLEFVADEGFIHMPSWLMAHLGVPENEIVLVRSTSLPKATFMKLQPHTKDFLHVPNPKELLEHNFGKFPCVTAGETIAVTEGERRYYLDVLEACPAGAVCSIDTDCAVDFAPPLDYVEAPPFVASQGSDEPPQPARFSGTGRRMDGKPVEMPTPSPAAESVVAPGVPKRMVRFGAPSASAAASGVSKAKEGGGKEQEKRFTGTRYSLKD